MLENDMEGGGLLHEHTKSIQTIAPGLTIHKVGGLPLEGIWYIQYVHVKMFETDMEGGGLLHEHTKSIQTIAPGLTIFFLKK
jgi:hypothetical protein